MENKPKSKKTTQNESSAKKMPPKGLLIGLIVGGVALLAIIIIAICLIVGGGVDYEATYNEFKQLETSMNKIADGNCYDLNDDFDDDYTTVAKYNGYVEGCVTEFESLETSMNKLGQTSGVKNDEDIKKAFEKFETTFKSIYSGKEELKDQLDLYAAYHEFYITISDSAADASSLKKAITAASDRFKETGNEQMMKFAEGFRERGLAYVTAIEKFKDNSSSTSLYNDLVDKMEVFIDYIDEEAPEIIDVTGLDFSKMNDLEDDYEALEKVVLKAYRENR